MNRFFRRALLIMICITWTLFCEFGFLMAYFTEHDLIAVLSVIVWFGSVFIFGDKIERGLK